MKFFIALPLFLFFNGCSTNQTHPIQLDNSPFSVIHKDLLKKHKNRVVKDVSMANRDWFFKLTLKKENGELLRNYQVVKTFYLVDHADYILIKGNKTLIQEYKQYFLENGVTGYIKTKATNTHRNEVSITLSHNKQYIKG